MHTPHLLLLLTYWPFCLNEQGKVGASDRGHHSLRASCTTVGLGLAIYMAKVRSLGTLRTSPVRIDWAEKPRDWGTYLLPHPQLQP